MRKRQLRRRLADKCEQGACSLQLRRGRLHSRACLHGPRCADGEGCEPTNVFVGRCIAAREEELKCAERGLSEPKRRRHVCARGQPSPERLDRDGIDGCRRAHGRLARIGERRLATADSIRRGERRRRGTRHSPQQRGGGVRRFSREARDPLRRLRLFTAGRERVADEEQRVDAVPAAVVRERAYRKRDVCGDHACRLPFCRVEGNAGAQQLDGADNVFPNEHGYLEQRGCACSSGRARDGVRCAFEVVDLVGGHLVGPEPRRLELCGDGTGCARDGAGEQPASVLTHTDDGDLRARAGGRRLGDRLQCLDKTPGGRDRAARLRECRHRAARRRRRHGGLMFAMTRFNDHV